MKIYIVCIIYHLSMSAQDFPSPQVFHGPQAFPSPQVFPIPPQAFPSPGEVVDTAQVVRNQIPDSESVSLPELQELDKLRSSLQSYQQQASELVDKPLTEFDQLSLRYWMTMIRKTEQTLVLFSLLKEKR